MGAQMQHQQLMAQQAAVIQQQQLMLSQQGAHWGMQPQPDPYASLYGSSTGAYPTLQTPNPKPRLTYTPPQPTLGTKNHIRHLNPGAQAQDPIRPIIQPKTPRPQVLDEHMK